MMKPMLSNINGELFLEDRFTVINEGICHDFDKCSHGTLIVRGWCDAES